MFLLLFLLSFSSDVCHSQVVYSRMMPYDPRYVIRRPVRRSAMEALERLRLPVARYFPQVDTQVASAPYQSPVAPLSGYQLSTDDLYSLPPQWTDDLVQQLPERNDDDGDYGNYEYEGPAYGPVYPAVRYPDEIYAQEPLVEPETVDGNLYNDLMVNYLLGDREPKNVADQSEVFGLQRRSEAGMTGAIPLSNVLEANKNVSNITSLPKVAPQVKPTPQVQVTAVPSAPEKKEVKSLVIPEPAIAERAESEDGWREQGQKEEPLFRPMQNSQRTTWSEMGDALARAKNSQYKSPIPLLKQMIQNRQMKKSFDPLTEELNALKNRREV